MKRLALGFIWVLGLCAGLEAQEIPAPVKLTVEPGDIARAECALLFHCMATLPAGEVATDGIVADGSRWEVRDYRQGQLSVVSFRPKDCGIATAATILTQEGNAYELLLTSSACEEGDLSPRGQSTRIFFKGRRPELPAAERLSFSAAAPLMVQAGPGPEFFLGLKGGYGWEQKRRFAAKPLAIQSDEKRTYILLAKGSVAPAVFGLEEGGAETVLDFQVYGDWIVVNQPLEAGVIRVGDGEKGRLWFGRSKAR